MPPSVCRFRSSVSALFWCHSIGAPLPALLTTPAPKFGHNAPDVGFANRSLVTLLCGTTHEFVCSLVYVPR